MLLLLCLVPTATALVGCGSTGEPSGSSGSGTDKPARSPDFTKELAGSPAPLAGLHHQAGELLDGDLPAFEQRMEELKGYPVVVNLWASWCGPCRAEFPHFEGAATELGRKVAFLGVNPDDDSELAADFLADNPVPYPSYSDPDRKIAGSLDIPRMIPATVFFDRDGSQTYAKLGAYTDVAGLKADVKTHAIDGDRE